MTAQHASERLEQLARLHLAEILQDYSFYRLEKRSPVLYRAFENAVNASGERVHAAVSRHEKLVIMLTRYQNLMQDDDTNFRRRNNIEEAPIDNDPVVEILNGFIGRPYGGHRSEAYDRVACDLKGNIRCRRMDEQTYASILDGTHYLFTHEPHYELVHGTVPDAEFRNGYGDAWVRKDSGTQTGEVS